jgi:hypothetical protein
MNRVEMRPERPRHSLPSGRVLQDVCMDRPVVGRASDLLTIRRLLLVGFDRKYLFRYKQDSWIIGFH